MSRRLWPKLTVARLALRDGARCAHCGAVDGLTVQHRGIRGMGGSPAAERPSNGLILCWALNTAIAADAEVAAFAEARGWAISQWADPLEVPVWDEPDGAWYRLGDGLDPVADRVRVGPL